MRKTIGLLAMLVAAWLAAPAGAADAPAPGKQTVLGKYLTAKEAFEVVRADRAKSLFLDIRSSAELMLVGATAEVDANVPFAEVPNPLVWDEKGQRPIMVPNAVFIDDVKAALAAKGLSPADKVILMCRSGDRSARAVNVLAGAGFTNVFSVIDGFEGEMSREGRRDVNGWKNAGLPWSYSLERSKMPLRYSTAR